eukprot:15359126-Alexandrium_andersonii.AAC.1
MQQMKTSARRPSQAMPKPSIRAWPSQTPNGGRTGRKGPLPRFPSPAPTQGPRPAPPRPLGR